MYHINIPEVASRETPFDVGCSHSVMVTWEKSSHPVLDRADGVRTRTCGFSHRIPTRNRRAISSQGYIKIQRPGGQEDPAEVGAFH